MKLNVFEAFSGIGAQKKAIDLINKKMGTEYRVVATSDWDIWANISYNSIHYNNDLSSIKNINIDIIKRKLLDFTHSLNSKTPIKEKTLLNLPDDVLRKLYLSYTRSNNLGSIINVNATKLLNSVPINEKINMIFYSFPCQDLSVAGKNQGMGIGKNTRSGLLWEIYRILSQLAELDKLPEFLLLENVVNMVSKRHKKDYDSWVNKLAEFGYKTQTFKFNSADFGLAQNRKRIYGLSIRTNNIFNAEFETSEKILEDFEGNDCIKNNEYFKKPNIIDFLRIDYNNEVYLKEALDARPNKTPSRKEMWFNNPILYSESSIKNNRDVSNYSRTITTKQDRNPNAGNIDLKGTILEKKYNVKDKANYRFITPREAFLLMGFEEKDYDNVIKNDFLKTKKDILYRQAGNSIAVNVLEYIFFNIYNKYWKPYFKIHECNFIADSNYENKNTSTILELKK